MLIITAEHGPNMWWSNLKFHRLAYFVLFVKQKAYKLELCFSRQVSSKTLLFLITSSQGRDTTFHQQHKHKGCRV